jgi:hypothetical protein
LTQENIRRRRSQATRTNLAHPRAITRRGKQSIPSTWWNNRNTTRSTGPGQVNLNASWIAFAFSTPRESTRPETAADSNVSQILCSRRPKGLIRRKRLKNPRVTSLKLIRRSSTSMVAPIHMSKGESRNSQPGWSWRYHLMPLGTLNGLRSPLPLTVVTTRTLCQSRGCILS